MKSLQKLLLDQIVSGLRRKSVTEPSRWATKYRMMGQPFPGTWNFKYHPWLKGMHDSQANINIGQKSAQMGYSETMLNITFYKMDIQGVNCLYVLPAQTPDAADFSAARFDPALELSDHLSKMFSDVKNIGHKRAGSTNLYIRGSKSRAGLKSIPVGFLVLDELDEMEQKNIPLAFERLSGQVEWQAWMLSTPTIPGFGINKYFNDSTKERFFFKCPSCNTFIELTFPESIIMTSDDPTDQKLSETHLICTKCKAILPHQDKHKFLQSGEWIPEVENRNNRGFYINQMYSSTVEPANVAKSYLLGQRDQAAEQEFFNSKLGMTHIIDGARLTDAHLNECIGTYRKQTHYDGNRCITMGIDVGSWIHFEIDEWQLRYGTEDINTLGIPRVINYGKVRHFEQLDELMVRYSVVFAVIDALPERRMSIAFANRFYKRVKTCFYSRGIQGKNLSQAPEEEHQISVDRTSWLDLSLGRFKKKDIILPIDIDLEYRAHMTALIRVPKKDDDGNITFNYVHADSEQDHYAHARNYSEIALPFAASIMSAHNIKAPV
jgi:hypothetical protein